jgi:hypothetical protein
MPLHFVKIGFSVVEFIDAGRVVVPVSNALGQTTTILAKS